MSRRPSSRQWQSTDIEKAKTVFYLQRMRSTTAVAALLCAAFTAMASEQILPPGGYACEADWINRSRFDTIGSLVELKYLERFAERGEVGAQLRLGLIKKTRDGKWIAPEDNSYNIMWLEKAFAQGSKSALWELNKFRIPQLTHEAYLRSMMDAAENEGNPWAATQLMQKTNGRWGQKNLPTSCAEDLTVDNKCAPVELLPISSARKWAEIAAEGGNVAAKEWLCFAATDGYPDRGQPKDSKAALKWCGLAVHNACAYRSISRYTKALIDNNEAAGLNSPEIKRWKKIEQQPWRVNSTGFFNFPSY